MRRRRIERCVLRAGAAFDEGIFDAALEAIEEAAHLDPYDESIKALAAKIRIGSAAPPPPAPSIDRITLMAPAVETVDIPILDPFEVPIDPFEVPIDPFELPLEEASTVEEDVGVVEDRGRGTRTWLAAAAALILLSGVGGWMWTRSRVDATTPPAAMSAAVHAPVASTASPGISPAPAVDPAVTPAEPTVSPQLVGDTIAQAVVQTSAGTTGAPTLPLPGPVVDPLLTAAANSTPQPRLGEVPTLPANAPVERALADAPAAAPSAPTIPAVSAVSTDIRTATPDAPDVPAIESAALRAPIGEHVASSPIASTTAPAAAPPAATPVASPASDERAIRASLTRYEAAYNRLDAAAAGSVWPSVDRRALARAFEGLVSQTVSLGDCVIAVTGPTARVECLGRARWTPRVGGGPQSAPRRWRFALRNERGDWLITDAEVR
jgi:hypothetical protein